MAILARSLNAPQTTAAPSPLGGRSHPVCIDLSGYGQVIIKKYLRGGLIRYFNRQTHLRWKSTRPRLEFDMLNRVRKIGINAPEPVSYVTKGGRLYQGWLITRYIVKSRSLAELCQTNPSRAKATLGDLAKQVTALIGHHILHSDLHPGNVLVDPKGGAYIIDVDKTRSDIGSRKKIHSYSINRWHRAIKKYHLPEWLDTAIPDRL
jgi:3-deoxy-D-manno-octulosonic acid kinase